ncbi:monocarboxylate transporter 12-like [Culicoides brevitarsis]|uniref:monocarboxylate transporter 12-like n=1 Tax=Culicoides brevitarsis TaxID=469753 RepID=UPI00307C9842
MPKNYRNLNNNAPDGGYGWIIVAGASLTNIFNQSLVSLFGLLFGDKITSITPSTGAAAIVMNVSSLFLNFSGLLTGPLLKFYSPRALTMFASFLSGFGLIASAFSTKVWHLLLCYSFCVGFALGVIIQAQFNAINQYFRRRKGCAVGIAVAGTGTGQALMPHVVRYLLEFYGFSGTVMIMGALAWNGLVGGSLFHPVEWHLKKKGKQKTKLRTIKVNGERKNSIKNEEKVTKKFKLWDEICSLGNTLFELLDLKLLRDPSFLTLTVGLALAYTASINFSMIFPYYLQNVANMTKSETALSMSMLAGADLASRLLLPILTDRLHLSSKLIFLIGIISLGSLRLVLAQISDKYVVMSVSIIYGLVRASTVVHQNLAVSEYCHKNPELFGNALGLNMTAKAIFVITLGQLLAYVRDFTGSYEMVLYSQAFVLLIVVAIWVPEMIYQKILDKRRESYEELCYETTQCDECFTK